MIHPNEITGIEQRGDAITIYVDHDREPITLTGIAAQEFGAALRFWSTESFDISGHKQ